MNLDAVAEEVARCYDKATGAYERAKRDDREETARNAGEGDTVKFNGRDFANEWLQQRAMKAVDSARDEAYRAIDKALRASEATLTAPPSLEETGYIVSLSMRDDLTEGEALAALSRYKSHATQKAIYGAAKRAGLLGFEGSRTDAETENIALHQMRGRVDRAFTYQALRASDESTRYVTRNSFAVPVAGNSLQSRFFALLHGNER